MDVSDRLLPLRAQAAIPASASLPLQPAQSNGRKLFVWTKAANESQLKHIIAKANATLLTAQTQLEKEIEPTIESTFQQLYQRKAQIGYVSTTHESWKSNLDSISIEIRDHKSKIKDLAGAVALLASEKEIVQVLSKLQQLEWQLHLMKRKNQGLILILQSSDHQNMLEFYKVKVKACEQLKYKPIQEKIKTLSLVYQDVESKFAETTSKIAGFPPKLKQQIENLQEELLRFMIYSAKSFETELPFGESEQKTMLTKLKRGMQKLLGQFCAPDAENQPAPPASQEETLEQQFIRSCQIVPLPTPYLFRCGQWFTTTPLLGPYREIQTEKEQLEGYAKELYSLVKQIENRLKMLCAGNLHPHHLCDSLEDEKKLFDSSIEQIEQKIIFLRNALYRKDFSEKVHAGLYYVAQLLGFAQEARVHSEFFQRMGLNSFHAFAQTQVKTVAYLTPSEGALQDDPHYFTSKEACYRLFKALKACSTLEVPQERDNSSKRLRRKTHDRLYDILSRVGPKTIKCIPEEDTMYLKLLARVPISENEGEPLPDTVRSLLTKKITEFLYFSTKNLDPEIDLLLHTLANEMLYSSAYRNAMKNDAVFRELIETYNLYSDWQLCARELEPISLIFAELHVPLALSGAEKTTNFRILYHYVAARQKDHELWPAKIASQSEQQKTRDVWAREQLKKKFSAIEDSQRYPSYFPTLSSILVISRAAISPTLKNQYAPCLYKSLALAFFSSEPFSQNSASQSISITIEDSLTEELPQTGPIATLMYKWMFDQMKHQTKHSFNFHELLAKCMLEYVTDHKTQTLWRELYDIGFTEVILYRLLCIENQKISRSENEPLDGALKLMRNDQHRKLWEEVMQRYDKFRQLFESPTRIIEGSEEHQSVAGLLDEVRQKASQAPLTSEKSTYIHNSDIIHWCLQDMERLYKTIVARRK